MAPFYNWFQLSFISIAILLIVALGGLITERSGVTNIALEGIMVIGAFLGIFAISKFEIYPYQPIALVSIFFVTTSIAYFFMKWLYPIIRKKWINSLYKKEKTFFNKHQKLIDKILFWMIVLMISLPAYAIISSREMPTQLILIMGILVGGLVGALYSSIHAFASIKMKADQIISATALNLFAPAVAVFSARAISSGGGQQIGFKSNFIINEVPLLSKIPVIGDILFKQAFVTTYIFFALAIIVAIVLNKTRFGLRLRACGENPHAADSLGINIYQIRFRAVLLSGFFAGIGGVIFVSSTSNEFNVTVGGFGFLAIAVLIFGNWKPSRVFIAAVFFGTIRTLASSYSSFDFLRNFGLDMRIYEMIPFILTLIVLAFFSKKSRAPKALGQIYDQGKR